MKKVISVQNSMELTFSIAVRETYKRAGGEGRLKLEILSLVNHCPRSRRRRQQSFGIQR